MGGARRVMVVEAALFLALARLLVLTVPFRRIAPWLALAPETGRNDETLAAAVREAVTVAARNAPWNAVCLPQAMAAKAMLARRGFGSSFHLGADYDGQGKLVAHAWLEAGGEVIIGADGIPGMAPLARFG
jgi:hypothetical protein